jgi:LysR family transcriptional regulator, transcriptional activator for bauABCD operon
VETELREASNLATPTGLTPITDLDLRLLRVFKAIVEERGLKAAQAALGVGLPTISKQLSDLEGRFGVRLCQRGRQRFELTPEGEIIYNAVIALFAGLDSFESEVAQVRRGLRGEIRIGVMDNTISDPRSPLVGALGALGAPEGSNLHLRLSVLDPESIELRVLDGRLDIGIVPIYKKRPGLEYRTIYREQSLLYCGRAHPLFDAETDPEPAVLKTFAFVEHAYVNGLGVEGFSTPVMTGATAWQVEAVAILIMTGRFLGYLPEHYAKPLLRDGSLRQLRCLQGGYKFDVAAVFKPITMRSSALTRLLRSLESCSPASK